MKKITVVTVISVLAFVLILMSACSPKSEEPENNNEEIAGDIMIAAAASLENTLADELIPLFNESYPDVKVSGTYDSSGKLQEQIEGGLDAAVFMSAATKQMDTLVEGGFADEANVIDILQNEVVLIKAVDSETQVNSFEDITKADTVAIGDPESVPAGQYAEEILKNLNVWDDIKVKSTGTNVTEVLNWVAEGSAEVGIVYKTDALSMPDKVEVIEAAPEGSLETPVIYPMAKLNNIPEEKTAAADAFIEFLQSEKALEIFEKAGFTVVK